MPSYRPVIGLEIHAELNTKTKMFCDSANDPAEAKPNVNVCAVCMGYPGTLPVINIEAVHKTVKVGLALGSRINEHSWFERKNYFYPDLPKGYQISQYERPFCQGGVLKLSNSKEIKIRRVHLEEDTGKLIHETSDKRQATSNESMSHVSCPMSLIDFNRAGVPLMELVTDPDIESGREAKEFGEELQLLFRYLGVSEADMERGQLRLEANLSLTPAGSDKLGTKVEIKNLNSFRSAERAIEYEVKRQTEVLERGEKVVPETRGWDENKGETFSQRQKEESHDYRYFPEPDLPPVRLDESQIEYIKSELPELPASRRDRFARQYPITPSDARVFTLNKDLGDYFEKVVTELEAWLDDEKIADQTARQRLIKLSANYLITEAQKLLDEAGETVDELKIYPEDFAELMVLIHRGGVSSSAAQTILGAMFETGQDPHQILEEKGLAQISDRDELTRAAQEVIAQNRKAAEDYKNGKAESLKFLVGQLMRATRGRANPQVGEDILRELLE